MKPVTMLNNIIVSRRAPSIHAFIAKLAAKARMRTFGGVLASRSLTPCANVYRHTKVIALKICSRRIVRGWTGFCFVNSLRPNSVILRVASSGHNPRTESPCSSRTTSSLVRLCAGRDMGLLD